MKRLKHALLIVALALIAGLLIPQNIQIPVQGASSNDWNHQTFWHEPWGSSVVHKGIDIFGKKGTPVVAATSGIILFVGELHKGGKVIATLGPKWRIHYYAHLSTIDVVAGSLVTSGEIIGTLGDSGNAKGKAPHVHYSIVSLLPMPWLVTTQTQGWKKMFYLNPHEQLVDLP